MKLGRRLKELRAKNNLSQDQLAEQLSVSRQAVSKWEMNASRPDIENIIQLSDLYHVSTDYLLKGHSKESENEHKEEKPDCRMNIMTWKSVILIQSILIVILLIMIFFV